jgi:hypothetical protein
LFEVKKEHVATEQFTAFVRKAACHKTRPDDTTTSTVTSTSVTTTTTTISVTSITTATVTSTSISMTTTTPTTVTSISITKSSATTLTTTVAVKTQTTGDIDDDNDVIMVDEVDFTLVRGVSRCYLPRKSSDPDSGDFFKTLLGLSLSECASAVAADPFCGATFHGRADVCYCVSARLGCDIRSSTRGDAVYVLTNSNKAATSRAPSPVTPSVTPSTTSVTLSTPSSSNAGGDSETDESGSGAGDEPTGDDTSSRFAGARNNTHLLALLALFLCIPLIIFAIYRCSSASDSDGKSEPSGPLPPPPPPMLLASGTTAVNSDGVFVYGDDYDEPSPDFFYTGTADGLAPLSPTPPLIRSSSWLQPQATLHFDGGTPPTAAATGAPPPSTRREVFTPLGEAFYSVVAHGEGGGGGGGAPPSPAHDAGAADTSGASFV